MIGPKDLICMQQRMDSKEAQFQKERRQLEAKLRKCKDEIRSLKQEMIGLKRKMAASKIRKPLDQLISRNEIAVRKAEVQEMIGPSFKIAPSEFAEHVLNLEDCRALRRIHRLSEERYEILSRLSGSKWASLAQVRRSEQILLNGLLFYR